jgi:translation initiation factor 2 subunit 2
MDFGKKKKSRGETAAAPTPNEDCNDDDYGYLLKRIYENLTKDGFEPTKKMHLQPPIVSRLGTKRVAILNFRYICSKIHRQQSHVSTFFSKELGTTSSINGDGNLIIVGRFNQSQVESILRKYIKEYVICRACNSADTLYYGKKIQCDACGAVTHRA